MALAEAGGVGDGDDRLAVRDIPPDVEIRGRLDRQSGGS